MLPSYSQYSPQGLIPAFSGFSPSGFPGAGAPQLSQVPFGQPGIHGGNAAFGQEIGQTGIGQPGVEHHFMTTLAQLAQQVAVQSAATQQFSAALLQLAQHLAVQAQYARLGGGQAFGQAFNGAIQPNLGFGQPFGAQGGQLPGVFGAQSVGQGPFATPQGLFGGFNPIAQQWANPQAWANRPQTIQ
jgi:hypothetical protein